MKTFGERIKEVREAGNVSQQRVADALKLHRSNYSKIENGHQNMTHEQLALFCQFMDVSADYLLGIEIKNKVVYSSNDQKEINLLLREITERFNKK